MRPPVHDFFRCPYCGEIAHVSQLHAYAMWLPGTRWGCPHCKEWMNTEDLGSTHEAKPKDTTQKVH